MKTNETKLREVRKQLGNLMDLTQEAIELEDNELATGVDIYDQLRNIETHLEHYFKEKVEE